MPEYSGHEYKIERRETRNGLGFEFYLIVDDSLVVTASELEERGHLGPEDGGENWTSQLRRYAGAYIDGLEAGA